MIRHGSWILLLAILVQGGCSTNSASSADARQETVVLLHGLGRSTLAMRYLQYRLDEAGFDTVNIGYPSTRLSSGELLALLHEKLEACCANRPRVHFVAHSLGGVLVRALLDEKAFPNLGRVVLLGTPSQGSALVDWLQENPVFRVLAGPTAGELGTGPEALPRRLPPPDYELGVIAGTHSLNPVGSWILEGPDDGIVSVESTRVEGMTDFLLTPADHVMMRYSDQVARAVIRFLRTGSFQAGEQS